MSNSSRKVQIIEITENLFSRKGYMGTSVRDIADAISIEPASLYSHFKSKEDILWEIASKAASEFERKIQPIFESELDTLPKLKAMIVEHVEVISRNLGSSAIFFHEWKHLSEPRLTQYAELRNNYERMFQRVLEKGIQENIIRNYDESFSSRAILSALNWTHTWYKKDGTLKASEIGERLADILLNGIIRTI